MVHGSISESWCFPTWRIRWNDFLHPSCSPQVQPLLPQLPFHHCMVLGVISGPVRSCFCISWHRIIIVFGFPLFPNFSPAHIKLLKDCIISVGLCAVCQMLHPFCCRHNPCEKPLDLYILIYLGLKWSKTRLTSQSSFKGTAQNLLILNKKRAQACSL